MVEPVRIPPLRAVGGELPSALDLRLRVVDPEMIEDLVRADEGDERDRLALQALRIGLLALRQARGRIDADAVRREGERILSELRGRLEQHDKDLQREMRQALVEYFDPRSGKLSDRLERLVKQDGELEQILRRQVGAKDSELSRALAASLGAGSPVLRLLDPTQSDGVVKALGKSVDDALAAQRERILAEFSLDKKDGALRRLVDELRGKHGELEAGFQKNVDAIRADFSLDVKDSPLSRLVGRVEEAQATIRREFDLNEEKSSLARLRGELLAVIDSQGAAATAFQEEVKVALAGMVARRAEAARSTRHGLTFQDDVCQFVERRALGAGDIASRSGETTGLVPRSKVGDCVVTLGPDRAASGSRIVVEAKEDASYTLDRARAEMEEARKNRGAQVGVFVMSKSVAPVGFPAFARRGDDVFLVWDVESPTTDAYLDAALSIAEALCTRAAAISKEKSADFDALDKAVFAVEKQIELLEEVETAAHGIASGSQRILERVEKTRKALRRHVETLREGLQSLR